MTNKEKLQELANSAVNAYSALLFAEIEILEDNENEALIRQKNGTKEAYEIKKNELYSYMEEVKESNNLNEEVYDASEGSFIELDINFVKSQAKKLKEE